MGWKSDQCTKMDAPRVKRDPQYYLPGIWVAHRVSLAHRGGRDAHRVKGDEHPPLPYEHPPLHWKCVGGRGGSLPPLWASIFVHWSLFQPIEIAIIIPTLSLCINVQQHLNNYILASHHLGCELKLYEVKVEIDCVSISWLSSHPSACHNQFQSDPMFWKFMKNHNVLSSAKGSVFSADHLIINTYFRGESLYGGGRSPSNIYFLVCQQVIGQSKFRDSIQIFQDHLCNL